MNTIRNRNLFLLLTVVLLGVGTSLWIMMTRSHDHPEVRVLAWVGYDEPEILSAFEADTQIRAKVRTAAGGDAVMAIFTSQPDDFDLIILDPEYIAKLAPAGRLQPLDREAYSWSGYPDVIRNCRPCQVENKLFGIPLRFGSNGLVFNADHVSASEASSYGVLWSAAVRGRIGIWDWYLPSMGVISLSAGNAAQPYRLSDTEFATVKSRLRTLRPAVHSIHASTRDMLAAMAAGETWIIPAGGEWVAGLLRTQGLNVDWIVPREGGILWMETGLIPVRSARPELAKQFIRWMQSPKGQALLATRRAYYGIPCNVEAIPLLSAQVQDILHVHSANQLTDLFSKLHIRELPEAPPPTAWQDAWERFKAGSL